MIAPFWQLNIELLVLGLNSLTNFIRITMNTFMLPPAERLEAWGSFRDSLPTLSDTSQFEQVAKFWAQCPFGKWVIHPEDSKNWPSVWELLHDGQYCRNAIALGIESTLRLGGVDAKRLKLTMVYHREDQEEFFVVIIDDTHVLNYSYGEAVTTGELARSVDTKYSYSWKGRSYQKNE
jgi:hypothetical protein